MNFIDMAILFGISMCLALIFVFAFAVTRNGWRGTRYLLPVVVLVIGLAVAVSAVLSDRNLSFTGFAMPGGKIEWQAMYGDTDPAIWPLRLASAFIVACVVTIAIRYFLSRGRPAVAGKSLFFAFILFFLTNAVINALFGTQSSVVLNRFYAPLVFFAAYATRTQNTDIVIHATKLTLLALATGSGLMIVVEPDLVLQRPYDDTWIPGLNVRLWGLASHANSLGAMALLYLMIALHFPYRRRLWNYLGNSITLCVLIVAQSKTVWIGALLTSIIFWYYRAGAKSRAASVAMTILGVITILAVLDVGEYWELFGSTAAGESVLTLSGRSRIWEEAINIWLQSPYFGYGPSLWDADFREAIGMNFAFSAHNQFLQSLASSGIFGLLGLIIYLVVMLRYAVRLATSTGGLSLAFGLFLILRCLTETPVETGTLFTGDFLVHLVIFSILLRMANARTGANAAQSESRGAPTYLRRAVV